MNVVKRYKPPLIREINSGDVMNSMGDYSQQYFIVYSKVAKRIDLKRSHYKKKKCSYVS